MSEVTIKFENENLEGLVAVGTYVGDAMARFGIFPAEACDHSLKDHHCSVVISAGIDLISPLTKNEEEHFATHDRKTNQRLACEAKIERSGEVVIMTDQTETDSAKEAAKDKFEEEFEALPLEKKFAQLFKMEALVLSETVSYVLDSPYKVFEKIGDVMAGFGRKMEEEAKKAKRPSETATPEAENAEPIASEKVSPEPDTVVESVPNHDNEQKD